MNGMYTKDCLLDSWEVNGSKDKNELYKLLEDLSDATDVIRLRSDNIQMFTVRDISEKSLNGYLHTANGTANTCIPMLSIVDEHGATEDLLRETCKESYMLIRLGNEYFFTTKHVLKTLSQRAGSAMGDFALRNELKIRFPRDSGYVAYMSVVPSECSIMYRKSGNAKKIYAVFSDRYKMLEQYPLIRQMIEGFEKEMGASDLVYYSVNNFMTEVYIEFPEKAKDFQRVYALPSEVVPGILIRISDSGDSSFFINGTTRLNRTVIYVPESEYSRKHTENASIEDIFRFVGNSVFAAYTKMPERFMELLQIPINDPVKYIRAVGKSIDLRKITGAAAETKLIESLVESVNPSMQYTAYDIATMYIEAGADLEWVDVQDKNGGQSRRKRNSDALSKLKNCLTKAAFFNFEKVS